MSASDRACLYILDRIQKDPDLHYEAGFGTEVFRLLCEAEAEITGKAMSEVEERRKETYFHGRQPRVKLLEERLRDGQASEVRDDLDACDQESDVRPPPAPVMPLLPDAFKVRLKTCSLCRRQGHNARTCAQRSGAST